MHDLSGFVGDRLYLDANVFIYGVEGFQRYDMVLRDLFELIDDRAVHVATSEVTLAEVLVVPLREGKPEIAGLCQELFAPGGPVEMAPVSREIILKSAEIRAHSSAKPIDAIHVATATISGAEFFISDDRRLDSTPVPKITLEELLRE